MHLQVTQIIYALIGLGAGGVVGLTFGHIQQRAARRNQQLQESGKLDNGWAVMPGSMSRVAYLLVALAFIQLVCPLLFANGTQWWVSGGVVLGYGWLLYKQLRERMAHR